MRALGKEVIEELIMNLKDAGCDEELITKCIKKYNNDDLKMLIKSLQCHRCCLLDKLHEEQKENRLFRLFNIYVKETNEGGLRWN